MKNWISPLGRTVLAAAVAAIMIGGTATVFAQDYHEHGPDHPGYGYGDDHDWHEHHERQYYQPGYYYAPPPVVYAPPPPQYYAPPVDLFFSIGIH